MMSIIYPRKDWLHVNKNWLHVNFGWLHVNLNPPSKGASNSRKQQVDKLHNWHDVNFPFYRYISYRYRGSARRQLITSPQKCPHITASVQRPFDSLRLPKEPLRLSKARRTLALTRAVPCPFGRMDGRINNDPSVRPSGRYAPLRTAQNYGIHVI